MSSTRLGAAGAASYRDRGDAPSMEDTTNEEHPFSVEESPVEVSEGEGAVEAPEPETDIEMQGISDAGCAKGSLQYNLAPHRDTNANGSEEPPSFRDEAAGISIEMEMEHSRTNVSETAASSHAPQLEHAFPNANEPGDSPFFRGEAPEINMELKPEASESNIEMHVSDCAEGSLQSNLALHADTNANESEEPAFVRNEAPGISIEKEHNTNVTETAASPHAPQHEHPGANEPGDSPVFHSEAPEINMELKPEASESNIEVQRISNVSDAAAAGGAPQNSDAPLHTHTIAIEPGDSSFFHDEAPELNKGLQRRSNTNVDACGALSHTPQHETDFIDNGNTAIPSGMKRRLTKHNSSSSDVENQQPELTPDVENGSSQSSIEEDKYKKSGRETILSTTTNPRILLRKIFLAIITDVPDEVLWDTKTSKIIVIITLIKEIILAAIISFFIVALVLFLDHKFMLNLPTARNYRRATFQLMNDDETLAHIEQYAGIKFMDMNEYNGNLEEIAETYVRIDRTGLIMSKRLKDLEEMENEINGMSEGYYSLRKQLGLDKFCEECVWSPVLKMSCIGRVNALEEKYATPRFMAMVDAMKKPSCTVSKEVLEKREKAKEEEDDLRKLWQAKKSDFCEDCEWDTDVTCKIRAEYMYLTYKTPLDVAKASLIKDEKDTKCSLAAVAEEDKYMERLCKECIWGPGVKLSCQGRVDLLMAQYKVTKRKAILDAMKKPACVKPE